MFKTKLALHWQILIGMAAGTAAGLLFNVLGAATPEAPAALSWTLQLADFLGKAFLRSLKFIAVPIVLFSLILGAASLDDIRRLSRIGGRTVAIYLGTTAIAISLGLGLANLLAPGDAVSDAMRAELTGSGSALAATKIGAATDNARTFWETLLNIIPTNPFKAIANGEMLQIVFISLVVGLVATLLPKERANPLLSLVESLNDITIKVVELLMLTAPIAVFCLLTGVMAKLGLGVLSALAWYCLAVITGLALMVFVVYPAALVVLGKQKPADISRFFLAILPAQLLAFSSSSSSATLPVTMECAEQRVGISERLTSFILPLGATLNMDGTALYQGVAAVFIAQLYGIDLTAADQLTIVLTATLASIGTAGVPGVGIVMLVIVLQAVNMPMEAMSGGIAIILAVDRLLDMLRTVTNVTGDCMVATVVAQGEGELSPVPRDAW